MPRPLALALPALLSLCQVGLADRIPLAGDTLGAHALAEDAPWSSPLALPAVSEVKGVDTEGWYLHASVDVESCDEQAEVILELGPADAEPFLAVLASAPHAGGQNSSRRLHLFTSPGQAGPQATDLLLRVRVEGGQAQVSDLRLQRFHTNPSRKLLGKANGHLGPDQLGCGALGFTGLTEHDHNAFSLIAVRPDGPAAKAGVNVGDLVLGVAGKPLANSSIAPGWAWHADSHEASVGRALEAAVLAGVDHVSLELFDGESVREVALALPFAGDLEDFPLGGALGEQLHADLVRWAVEHQKPSGSWPGTDAVNPALGGLALLGTGDPVHEEAVQAAVDYLMAKNPAPSQMRGLAYWTVAFQGMLFAERYLQSDDESLLPWISEAIEWLPSTTHESKWGMQAFGHGPDGLPYDNKALMAPAAHILVFDALARRCGVESKVWEHIQPYVLHSWSDPEQGGHGGMGYNGSYKDKGEFWSRSGLTALAGTLRGDSERMTRKLCLFMEERHAWMLNSHAYGEPGAALGLLSLAVASPGALERILPQWRWRFLCAWEPGYGLRYSTPHMGAPYMGGESVVNLAYLLLFASKDQGLVMAGAKATR